MPRFSKNIAEFEHIQRIHNQYIEAFLNPQSPGGLLTIRLNGGQTIEGIHTGSSMGNNLGDSPNMTALRASITMLDFDFNSHEIDYLDITKIFNSTTPEKLENLHEIGFFRKLNSGDY